MTPWLTEQDVEDTALRWFNELGYDHVHGGDQRKGTKYAPGPLWPPSEAQL